VRIAAAPPSVASRHLPHKGGEVKPAALPQMKATLPIAEGLEIVQGAAARTHYSPPLWGRCPEGTEGGV
jgi:hypothetical protein